MSEESLAWWTGIRQTPFFTPAEPKPEPELRPEEVAFVDWAARRAELGLGGYDSDFVGIDGEDQASGMPSWRRPFVPEQPEQTDLDRHAIDRAAAGIKTASAVFGAEPPRPRTHSSPYSI